MCRYTTDYCKCRVKSNKKESQHNFDKDNKLTKADNNKHITGQLLYSQDDGYR